MRKFNLMCLGLLAGATLAGCSDDALRYDNAQNEAYVRDFIERYGVPEAGHTFSMATRSSITVKSSTPVDVEICGMYGGKQYTFADWKGVSGTQVIPFDIPRNVTEVAVLAGEDVYYAKIGDVVTIGAPAKAKSRATATTFPSKTIVRYPTAHTVQAAGDKAGYFAPYKIDESVYYGAIHPTYNKTSFFYYDLESHSMKDANGGKIHYWNDHGNRMPTTILKQLLNPESSYTEDIGRVYSVNNTVPSLYVNYVKKSLNYEMGILIGDLYTLSGSNTHYLIPMLTSEGLDEAPTGRNQMLKLVQKEGEKNDFKNWSGVTVDFFFDKTEDNVKYRNEELFKFDFENAYAPLKTAIKNLSSLYEDKKLPKPIDLADLDEGINKNYPKYTQLIKYKENEAGEDFYTAYQGYLAWCLENLEKNDKTTYDSYYNELLGLKEWLGTKQYMMSPDDIPVVTRMKDGDGNVIEDRYIVRFPLAKRAEGFEALAADESDNSQLYTTLKNDYTVYRVMDCGVAIHPSLFNHEYVFYVKNLNDGKIVTTLDGDIRQVSPKMTGMNDGATAYGSFLCWDVDGNGDYDIIFNHSSTGLAGYNYKDPFTWILACEDLGGIGDYDFNDIVVGIQYASSNVDGQETVRFYPLAAGGVYPAYLMYNEKYKDGDTEVARTYIVGKEIHEWLGGQVTGDESGFINTGSDFPHETLTGYGHAVTFNYQSGFANNHFADLMGDIKDTQSQNSDDNSSFVGFWVLVDKDNDLAKKYSGYADLKEDMNQVTDINNFNEATANCQKVMAAAAQNSSPVPMMMVLGSDWEWPAEKSDISITYPTWKSWLSNRALQWYGQDMQGDFIEVKRDMVTKRPDVTKAMTPEEE